MPYAQCALHAPQAEVCEEAAHNVAPIHYLTAHVLGDNLAVQDTSLTSATSTEHYGGCDGVGPVLQGFLQIQTHTRAQCDMSIMQTLRGLSEQSINDVCLHV